MSSQKNSPGACSDVLLDYDTASGLMLHCTLCFTHSILLSCRSPMPAQRNFSAQLQLKVLTFFFLSTVLKCCKCDGAGVSPLAWWCSYVEMCYSSSQCGDCHVYVCAVKIMHHIHKSWSNNIPTFRREMKISACISSNWTIAMRKLQRSCQLSSLHTRECNMTRRGVQYLA